MEAGGLLVAPRGIYEHQEMGQVAAKLNFGIQTFNLFHGFTISTPEVFVWQLHSLLMRHFSSLWFLEVVSQRHTFSSSFFFFLIAAHMLCPLRTSQQELLLQFLTVWSIFMLLVPCCDLFLILRNIHFQAHLLKLLLRSSKNGVRHGGKWGLKPVHVTQEQLPRPVEAVFAQDTES